MADSLLLSAKLLRAQGLNLDGVALDSRGRVAFSRRSVLNFDRVWKNSSFQKDVRAARRAAEKLAPQPQQLDVAKSRLFATAIRTSKLDRKLTAALGMTAASEQAAEFEQRAGQAISTMQRSAVIRLPNRILILSTQNAADPEVIAEAETENEIQAISADALLTGAELVWELFTGLLTLLGVPLRTGLPVGKFVQRIVDVIRRNRRLRRLVLKLLYAGKKGQLTAFDLLTLIKELIFYGFTWDCVRGALDEIVDLSFWGVIRLLFKLQARLTPGVGQALLLADLGLIIVELAEKVSRLL